MKIFEKNLYENFEKRRKWKRKYWKKSNIRNLELKIGVKNEIGSFGKKCICNERLEILKKFKKLIGIKKIRKNIHR